MYMALGAKKEVCLASLLDCEGLAGMVHVGPESSFDWS